MYIFILTGEDLEYVMKEGRFVILGEGGYGIVLLARHRSKGHLLAIKMVKLHPRYNLAQTLKEASIGVLLNQTHATPKCHGLVIMHIDERHAHVGMVHGYIGDPSSLKSVTIQTLFNSKEKRKAITAMHSLQMVHDIAMCLMAIHELGVVCTDLKADNIMTRKDGEGRCTINLIDFGLATYKSTKARQTYPKEKSISLQATYPHMPLEYFSQGICGPKTDIYAMGFLAFHMSTDINLKLAAKACMNLIPNLRPSAEEFQQDVACLIEMEGKKHVKD